MKNTFKFNHSKSIKTITALVFLATVGFLVYSTISAISYMDNIFSAIVTPLVFAIIVFIVGITLLLSSYTVTEEGLLIKLSIAKYTLDAKIITELIFDKVNNILYLHYFVKEDMKIHHIQIRDSEFENFKLALLAVNPEIVYKEITPKK